MGRIKGIHFEREIVELCTSWRQNHHLSSRKIESMMRQRGLSVDHATISRWIKKFLKNDEAPCKPYDEPPSTKERVQESYVKIRGQWCYLYLLFNDEDHLVDFFVSSESNKCQAVTFFLDEHQRASSASNINTQHSRQGVL